jgi:integrase
VPDLRHGHLDRAQRLSRHRGPCAHEPRHTAASLAIASGASIIGVQSTLGHASAAMTLDRHGDLFGDELDAVVDRMDAARADWHADRGPIRARPAPRMRRRTGR